MYTKQKRKSTLFCMGLVGLLASLAAGPVMANDYDGNVRLFFGQKWLDGGDWNTVDQQNEFGAIFDIKKTSWPVSIAFDVMFSGEDKNRPGAERGRTFEQHLGVRKIWTINDSKFHPYLGGGIAFIQAKQELIDVDEDKDSGVGGWIGAGADWHVSRSISLGLDVRYSKAGVTLFNRDVEAGGWHTAATLGFRW